MPGSLTVSEVLLAALVSGLALAGAFVLGWWLRRSFLAPAKDTHSDLARVALDQLRTLASSVRADVDQHRQQVKAVHEQLHDGDSTNHEQLAKSVRELMDANNRLQRQLASAEETLVEQTREIELYAAHARTDALTETLNRGGFDDELARRMAEWQRRARPFCLLMIDVDFFKQLNDALGHQAGDQVLKAVAIALKTTMREMDLVARYGGDEFAVILPDTIRNEARVATQRALQAIEALDLGPKVAPLELSVSAGLAEVQPGDDAAALIRRADEALYAAKQSGRDCAFFYDGQHFVELTNVSPPEAPPKPVIGIANDRPTFRASCHPGEAIFLAELARRVAESQRTKAELAVLVLEVDGVEELATRFGSGPSGDIVAAVVDLLRSWAREMDMAMMVARHRLAVMLPGSTPEAAQQIAARVQDAVVRFKLPIGNTFVPLTVSAGVACYTPTDDAKSLYNRAAESVQAGDHSVAASALAVTQSDPAKGQ